VSSNSAGCGGGCALGGGLVNDTEVGGHGTVSVTTSTFSGNSVDYGGGAIYNDGESSGHATLSVNGCTFSGNTAPTVGGGIYNDGLQGSATLVIGDTILVSGATGVNIYNVYMGQVISHGYNLSSDAGGGTLTNATDRVNTNAMLGPLQDNGGPTFTHALSAGSPAIDAGNRDAIPALGLDVDQRGLPRPSAGSVTNAAGGDGSDIGAFEVQPPNTPPGSNVSTELEGGDSTPGGVTVTFSNVTASGNTTLTTSTNGPALPGGFQLGTPPTYYDISTTATYTGRVTVCINYGNVSFPNANKLKLLHYDNTANQWVNVTTSKDTVNHIICGLVSSLSPFVVTEDDNSADLRLAINGVKSASKGNTLVTYTITVTNSGPDAASSAVVTDPVPSGTTFVSASANKGSLNTPAVGGTGTVTWSVGDLLNSGTAAAQISVTVAVKGKSSITSTATVTSDTFDPNPANNTATVRVSTKGK
jgi:uncharacterized repeat protein (TIGR01451 family)